LGHTDKSVTAIYSQCAYFKEVRRVLSEWAKDLLVGETMTYVGDTLDRSMLKWRGKQMPPEAHEPRRIEASRQEEIHA